MTEMKRMVGDKQIIEVLNSGIAAAKQKTKKLWDEKEKTTRKQKMSSSWKEMKTTLESYGMSSGGTIKEEAG